MTTVLLGELGASPETHAVYTRPLWSDEWTLEPNLWADEIVWSTAPQISTARLWWDYGRLQRAGSSVGQTVEKLREHNRIFVKIAQTVAAGSATEYWYGSIEITEDQQGGAIYAYINGERTVLATGEQQLTAYGLESMLELETVRTSQYTRDGANRLESGRALTFNRGARGNRSRLAAFGGTHVFSSDPDDLSDWTTRDIVAYLLRWCTPKGISAERDIPWALADTDLAGVLSQWDAPELPQAGRSIWGLLGQLITRHRLTGFRVSVSEQESPDLDIVQLIPFTFAAAEIEHDLGANVPANANQVDLVVERDRTAAATLKLSSLDQFDAVLCRGRRRTATFSISDPDSTLGPGWTAAQETAYEAGFSGDAGYAALELADKQERNAEIRLGEELRDVYRRFVMPATWDGKAGGGEGPSDVSLGPCFPPSDDFGLGIDPVEFYDLDLAIMTSIPLLEGVDYSGDKIKSGSVDTSTGTDQERPPYCVWKLPGTSPARWQSAETLGLKGELEETETEDLFSWSATLRVPGDGRAIELIVQGAPQHVIAYTDFTPLSGVDDDCGENEWRDAIFTVAVEEDRHAEGSYGVGDGAYDEIERVKVIDCGDEYRLDFVAISTVVGIADDGTLERSLGGWLNDDTAQLDEIAKLAHSWYSVQRYALMVETENPPTGIGRGYLIANLNLPEVAGDAADSHYQADINTVVTELRITNPRADGGEPPPTRMRITTGAGELDPMELLGKLPEPPIVSWGEETGFHKPEPEPR